MAEAVSLWNTSDQFTDVNANDALNAHMVDLTYALDITSGLSIDYSISDGNNTHTGTVEAVY